MDKLNKNIEDANKSTEKLRNNLDKVNVKTHDLSVSAKDVANTYKKEFQDVMSYITLQIKNRGNHNRDEYSCGAGYRQKCRGRRETS